MADHGRDAGEHTDEVASEREAEQCRRRTLGDVEERDRHPELEAERPPDVRRDRVAAPDRPYVDTSQEPREPVRPRHAAEEVANGDEKGVGYD